MHFASEDVHSRWVTSPFLVSHIPIPGEAHPHLRLKCAFLVSPSPFLLSHILVTGNEDVPHWEWGCDWQGMHILTGNVYPHREHTSFILGKDSTWLFAVNEMEMIQRDKTKLSCFLSISLSFHPVNNDIVGLFTLRSLSSWYQIRTKKTFDSDSSTNFHSTSLLRTIWRCRKRNGISEYSALRFILIQLPIHL